MAKSLIPQDVECSQFLLQLIGVKGTQQLAELAPEHLKLNVAFVLS